MKATWQILVKSGVDRYLRSFNNPREKVRIPIVIREPPGSHAACLAHLRYGLLQNRSTSSCSDHSNSKTLHSTRDRSNTISSHGSTLDRGKHSTSYHITCGSLRTGRERTYTKPSRIISKYTQRLLTNATKTWLNAPATRPAEPKPPRAKAGAAAAMGAATSPTPIAPATPSTAVPGLAAAQPAACECWST